MRIDIYLTKHCHIQSRNKAHELIKANKIKINDKIITKPSFNVDDNDTVNILEEDFFCQSRGLQTQIFLR
jgi:23S rRNA (cytidine1920-2'-O)/16S rRNA (cytidine1409-2'-O)-methyltransferase